MAVNDIFNKAKDHLRAIAGDAMAISVKENKKLLNKYDEMMKRDEEGRKAAVMVANDGLAKLFDGVKDVEGAVKNQEVAESVTIKNPEAITGDLKSGLEDIITTLKEEVRNFDKEVVVKNDLGQLATLFKSSNDRKEVIKVLNAVKDSVDSIKMPDVPDTTALLVRLIETVEGRESLSGILGEIRDKEFFLPPVLSVDLDPNLIEKDRVKVVLRDDQVAQLATSVGSVKSMHLLNGGGNRVNPATEDKQDDVIDNQTNGSQRTIITDGATNADVLTNASSSTDIDDSSGLAVLAATFARVNDTTVKNMRLDSSAEFLIADGYEHHEVHDGTMYRRCWDFGSIANNNSGDLLIITPNTTKWGHFKLSFSTGGDSYGYLYEDTTVSGNGTQITPTNFNRNSANTAVISTYHTPTVTTVGTLMCAQFNPGGTGGNSLGGSARDNVEWILQQDTIYLFRVTNIAGTPQIVFTALEWYEHTDRN